MQPHCQGVSSFLPWGKREKRPWSGLVMCLGNNQNQQRGTLSKTNFTPYLFVNMKLRQGCENHAIAIFCCDVLSVFMSLCARAATVTLILGHNKWNVSRPFIVEKISIVHLFCQEAIVNGWFSTCFQHWLVASLTMKDLHHLQFVVVAIVSPLNALIKNRLRREHER